MQYLIKYIQSKLQEKKIEAAKFDIIVNNGQLFATFIGNDRNELVAVFSGVVSVEKIKEGEAT